ncbi:MAG: hypothetical protein JTJ12_23620 [Eubacterium sp.]|nr:hypothetical protein [Eubacterium sp.]
MDYDFLKVSTPSLPGINQAISQLQNVFSVQASISSHGMDVMIEEMAKPFASLSQEWFDSLAPVMSAFSSNITKKMSESFNIDGIAYSMTQSFNIDGIAHSITGELSESICSSLDNDYVILDKSLVETYEIPESLAIPLGKYRVKMSTDVFISIISLLVSIILSISIALYQSNQGPTESETQQIQLDETQNVLLQTQNQLLYDLLHSIDTSSSTESESLQSLKKEVEEQNLHLSRIEKSLDSIEKSLDNNALSDNTESEK